MAAYLAALSGGTNFEAATRLVCPQASGYRLSLLNGRLSGILRFKGRADDVETR
jgi:hypothetical protein